MQSLFGIVMALVPGYLLFDLVGLKGDLGALVIGMLLASHPSSSELSRALFHFKELLLVGFFVSIGLAGGLPTFEDIAVALCLLLLLPIKAVVYALLLWAMRVRHRTGWLAAVALMQFSEFGLIVVAVGAALGLLEQRWLLVLSVALSLSFVASSAVNALCRGLIERLAARAPQQNQTRLHPEDRPADITGAEVIILGMGRVGRSAYDRLVGSYHMKVAGVDADGTRVERLSHEGRWVVEGDSSDAEFWNRLGGREKVRFAVIAMPRHGANLSAVRALRDGGFTGPIAAVARYDDEADQAVSDGADTAFNVYTGAGLELADQVMLVQRPAQQPCPIRWTHPLAAAAAPSAVRHRHRAPTR